MIILGIISCFLLSLQEFASCDENYTNGTSTEFFLSTSTEIGEVNFVGLSDFAKRSLQNSRFFPNNSYKKGMISRITPSPVATRLNSKLKGKNEGGKITDDGRDVKQIVVTDLTKLVGGRRVRIESYPFVVSIWLRFESPLFHSIGTLISTRHVLTAAHCMCWNPNGPTPVPFNRHLVGIRVGVTSFSEHYLEYDVLYTYIHWKWWSSRRFNRLYDIAVIELSEDVELSPRVNLVSLATYSDSVNLLAMINARNACTIYGWAPIESADVGSSEKMVFQDMVVRLMPLKECYDALTAYNGSMFNSSLETCTTEYTKGACSSNSGGPLVCGGKQYGILSWGGGCAKHEKPSVYMRVDTLFDWILKQMTYFNGRPYHKEVSEASNIRLSFLTALSFWFFHCRFWNF